MELAYWQYVEIHPAHVLLPSVAVDEASNILTWAYSGMTICKVDGNTNIHAYHRAFAPLVKQG
jgi:hypothetical protein